MSHPPLEERIAALDGLKLEALTGKLTDVEGEIYQYRNRSNQEKNNDDRTSIPDCRVCGR